MTAVAPRTVEVPSRMTAKEVAAYTGYNVHVIYQATRRGDLRGRPPRGQVRPILYRIEDVERWLDGEE